MDGPRALTGAVSPGSEIPVPIPEEERLRADVYGLLAYALVAPPDASRLAAFGKLLGDGSAIGAAFVALARAAAETSVEAVAREYHDLFVGLGRGELLPYASYYLTGFLHEKPLAELRGALAKLGIECRCGVTEPEDHIAVLCEIMAGLITGAFGRPASLAQQMEFFDTFLAPWAGRFFLDLQNAKAARLYATVGRIGSLFLDVEQTAFAIA